MLEINNLTVKYGASDEACALSDVTLRIAPGERVAVIGANGAGKSTLLLALTGIIAPVFGEILVDNVHLEKKTLRELRKKLGMVFQNPDDQLFMPTVYEDAAFGPRNYGAEEAQTEAAADEIFGKLGIAHLKNRMSHRLSGGEKRLAALAGVLIMEPSVLLMDEPSSFLDPRARRGLIKILGGLDRTMVIATHDLDMALDLCGRAVLLKGGQIRRDGPAEEILRDGALLEECGLELPLSLGK